MVTIIRKRKTKFEMRVALRNAMAGALLDAYTKAGVEKTWKECENEILDSLPKALQKGFNVATVNMAGAGLLIVQYALAHFEELMSPYMPEKKEEIQ